LFLIFKQKFIFCLITALKVDQEIQQIMDDANNIQPPVDLENDQQEPSKTEHSQSSECQVKQLHEPQPPSTPEDPHTFLHIERPKIEQRPDVQKSTTTTCKAENFGDSLVSGFSSLWKKSKFCDVTFVVGTDEIQCHRLVLATVSSYFQKKFNAKVLVGETIEVRNVEASLFRSILEFAYTGQIELEESNVQSLLVACKFFQIESLLRVCEQFASTVIAACNCFDVLSFSKKMSLELLEKNTINFIENHLDLLSEDKDVCENNIESVFECFQEKGKCLKRGYLPMTPENQQLQLLEIILRYVSNQPDLADDIPNLFQRILLFLVPHRSLVKALRKEPSLMDNVLVQHMVDLAHMTRLGTYSEETPDLWKSYSEEYNTWGHCYTSVLANVKEAISTSPKLMDFNDERVAEPDTQILTIELIFRPYEDTMVVGGMTLRYGNNKTIIHGMRILKSSCERHIVEFEEVTFACLLLP